MAGRSHSRQVLASVLVALAIVALVIVVVTARFGPTSTAELEHREELLKQRQEQREEELERREKAREERREGG